MGRRSFISRGVKLLHGISCKIVSQYRRNRFTIDFSPKTDHFPLITLVVAGAHGHQDNNYQGEQFNVVVYRLLMVLYLCSTDCGLCRFKGRLSCKFQAKSKQLNGLEEKKKSRSQLLLTFHVELLNERLAIIRFNLFIFFYPIKHSRLTAAACLRSLREERGRGG